MRLVPVRLSQRGQNAEPLRIGEIAQGAAEMSDIGDRHPIWQGERLNVDLCQGCIRADQLDAAMIQSMDEPQVGIIRIGPFDTPMTPSTFFESSYHAIKMLIQRCA